MGRPSSPSIDVARSATSGGKAAGRTLIPKPRTTCSPEGDEPASARMPASLRLPAYMSFGHFTPVRSPVAASTPSATATPAAIVISESAARDGCRMTDTYNPAPGGDDQRRPRRPRPDDWALAAMTTPSGAPFVAAANARSFVEPTSSCHERSVKEPSREPMRANAWRMSSGTKRFNLEAQIHRRRGVGQRANRHVIRACRRQLGNPLQRDAAGDFGLRTPAASLHGLDDLVS